jgi:hypothetical protein
VDASEAASIAKILSDSNGFSDRVIIIRGKIEELRLPERVDIIISEPIGTSSYCCFYDYEYSHVMTLLLSTARVFVSSRAYAGEFCFSQRSISQA